jgi:hypothetical protein
MIPEDTYWATTEYGDALVDEHLGAKLGSVPWSGVNPEACVLI